MCFTASPTISSRQNTASLSLAVAANSSSVRHSVYSDIFLIDCIMSSRYKRKSLVTQPKRKPESARALRPFARQAYLACPAHTGVCTIGASRPPPPPVWRVWNYPLSTPPPFAAPATSRMPRASRASARFRPRWEMAPRFPGGASCHNCTSSGPWEQQDLAPPPAA